MLSKEKALYLHTHAPLIQFQIYPWAIFPTCKPSAVREGEGGMGGRERGRSVNNLQNAKQYIASQSSKHWFRKIIGEAEQHTNKEGIIGLDFWPHGLEEVASRHDIEIHVIGKITDLE